MLTYACVEHQWTESLINAQHIVNECFLYIFCLLLVYFSILETKTESRFKLGFVFMILFYFWLSLNFIFIVW